MDAIKLRNWALFQNLTKLFEEIMVKTEKSLIRL